MLSEYITQFFTVLNSITGGNQFVSAMLLGWVGYLSRGIPRQIVKTFDAIFIHRLVLDEDGVEDHGGFSADILEMLINKHNIKALTRNWFANSDFTTSETNRFKLSPGYGRSILNVKGRFIVLNTISLESSGSEKQKRRHILTTFGRQSDTLEDFINALARPRPGKQAMMSEGPYGVSFFDHKDLEELCLTESVRSALMDAASDFFTGEKRYLDLGLAWKSTILLGGEPGTGKTSLAAAMSKTFEKIIVPVKLSSFKDDAALESFIRINDVNRILLIEDVHAYDFLLKEEYRKSTVVTGNSEGVTLSGVLNALNGAKPLQGCMVIMTTNYIERLDKALVRPSRCDLVIDLPRTPPEVINDWIDERIPGFKVRSPITVPLRGADINAILATSPGNLEKTLAAAKRANDEIPERKDIDYSAANVLDLELK